MCKLRRFYRNILILLNCLAVPILVIIGMVVTKRFRVESLTFMWNWICLAVTVFLDVSQRNVYRIINQKRIAVFVALGVLILTLATILVDLS